MRAGEGDGGFGNIDRQHVAGRDSRRDAANGVAIDADGSSIDPRLNPGAGGGVEIRQMSAEHEIQPLTRVAAVAEKCADGHCWCYPIRVVLVIDSLRCAI